MTSLIINLCMFRVVVNHSEWPPAFYAIFSNKVERLYLLREALPLSPPLWSDSCSWLFGLHPVSKFGILEKKNMLKDGYSFLSPQTEKFFCYSWIWVIFCLKHLTKFFTHLLACPWGSMNRHQRWENSVIIPFSTDKVSLGSPAICIKSEEM